MIIGDIPRLNARRYGDRPAFKNERRQVTFAQANRRMNALIRALYAMGLRKRDRVAVLLYNCTEYCELLYALPKGGLVMVPLNYRLVGRELKYILDNSEARLLIYDREFAGMVEEIRADLETVNLYIAVDRSGGHKCEDPVYDELIEGQPSDEVNIPITEQDLAYIMYTSGTTGFPKGAMLTNRNIMINLYNMIFERSPKPDDVLLDVPPLYHCAAQSELMVRYFYGSLTITLKRFQTEEVLDTINRERPNIVHLVPAMLNMVMNHPKVGDYDFSFVEQIQYGASSIMRPHLVRAMEVFGCKFFQTAGLTEAGPALTFLRPEDHVIDGPEYLVRRLGSAGREAKLTEVRIVDKEGNECPPDTPGEEIARGDNIMKGYWRMPEETANTIIDGWLHTGDICMRDEGGYIYYVDRIKDMINRGGENVYPREVEEVISTHPRVLEVAVIGVPDERLQEEIMAIVVLKEGPPVDAGEIIEIVERNMARFKKPRYVTFVDELPKTASGKILKRVLKKQYEQEIKDGKYER
ncbi:MAG: long-chain-fatty-acid--CoA ligase [Deltaproteobacteria bacterium]|nr:long-chain-fatty-acid--CoA ligase [Deltaproteobacteria bacterium]